jgi:hypothetical protein
MQSPDSPAAHRGLPVPPPPPLPAGRESRWLPAIGALAVILFVSVGGFLLAGEPTAAGQELTGDEGKPGAPVSVGPVSVRPAPGWTVAEQIPDPPQLRLNGGAAQLYVVVPPAQGAAEELLHGYVDQALAPQARQLSVSAVRPVELPSGQPASLLSYVGSFEGVASPLEGEVLALVSPVGTPVVFDGWAPEGLWVAAREEVRSMIATAEIA